MYVHPDEKDKTVFSIGQGFWQFTVMHFGLCNAPATFERLFEIDKLNGPFLEPILQDVENAERPEWKDNADRRRTIATGLSGNRSL
jgi:hypothetical protein